MFIFIFENNTVVVSNTFIVLSYRFFETDRFLSKLHFVKLQYCCISVQQQKRFTDSVTDCLEGQGRWFDCFEHMNRLFLDSLWIKTITLKKK
jgi:hypothetical protein